MDSVRFIHKVYIACILVHCTQGMHDGSYDYLRANDIYQSPDYADDNPTFRHLRNIYQDRNSQSQKVRFGWQNPIRKAPTLRPSQYVPVTESTPSLPPYIYPTRTTTVDYEDIYLPGSSNRVGQYVKPPFTERPPTAEPQKWPRCPDKSRMDKRSGLCTELGSSCGENMAFYENPLDREYGECDCIQNANRPLVYHPQTGKCYFVFQQAYCKPKEWLVIVEGKTFGSYSYRCSRNPCHAFGIQSDPNWNWASNGQNLNLNGPVGLLNERKCTLLGSACTRTGKEPLIEIISNEAKVTGVSLAFKGERLVCTKNEEIEEVQRDPVLACKPGLFNKWKLEGRCGNS